MEIKEWEVGDIRFGHEVLPPEQRKTLLLLADDIRDFSGIATMARSIVIGTCHKYNWVQVAARMKHHHNGKVIDFSKPIQDMTGIKDAQVRLLCCDGYGNPDIIREVIAHDNPAGILFYTDPRFWMWLFAIEHEIRQSCPMMYYNIWDELPYPDYNKAYYQSCDAIFNISKQTVNIVNLVLRNHTHEIDLQRRQSIKGHNGEVTVLDNGQRDVLISYIPHGIDSDTFKPIPSNDIKLQQFRNGLLNGQEFDFIMLYNSRNIRRKQTTDLMIAYKLFCNKLPDEQRKRVLLLLKTDPVDPNGTDLYSVYNGLLPECDVRFVEGGLSPEEMAMLYNIADVELNVSSAEGFGLSCAEAIMCGTPVIANVTGGLQDQMRFEENGTWSELNVDHPSNSDGQLTQCGKWAFPIFPQSSSQGSPPTPYIYDSRATIEAIITRMMELYEMDPAERRERGLSGREWLMGDESQMSLRKMANNFMDDIETTFGLWQPRKRFSIFKPIMDTVLENKGVYDPTTKQWV